MLLHRKNLNKLGLINNETGIAP
mgnify:CR=1